MLTTNEQRLQGALRTALIGYGIAAYSYFLMGPGALGPESHDKPEALGLGGSASGFLLGGVGVQILLILVHVLTKRVLRDPALTAQAMWIVELIADGATVLLFALATFGGILHAPDQL